MIVSSYFKLGKSLLHYHNYIMHWSYFWSKNYHICKNLCHLAYDTLDPISKIVFICRQQYHPTWLSDLRRWTYDNRHTKTVAAFYLWVVGIPFLSWAINPGVSKSSWSMDTHCPGCVILVFLPVWFGGPFDRHDFGIAFPNWQAVHLGILQSTNLLCKYPVLAMVLRLLKGKCANWEYTFKNYAVFADIPFSSSSAATSIVALRSWKSIVFCKLL